MVIYNARVCDGGAGLNIAWKMMSGGGVLVTIGGRLGVVETRNWAADLRQWGDRPVFQLVVRGRVA